MGYVRQPWTIKIAYRSMVKVIQNEFVLMSVYISLVKVGKEKIFHGCGRTFQNTCIRSAPASNSFTVIAPFFT